jgi:hypothetical protein
MEVHMKKILFLFFCLFILFTTITNAQSHGIFNPGARIGGSSIIWFAVELRYEYLLNDYFSVGSYIYYEDSFGIGISGRYYPLSKSFFLELNSGYNLLYRSNLHLDHDTQEWLEDPEIYSGIDIIPGLGWKIDVGKPGGFYITPSLKVPIVIRWNNNPPKTYFGSLIGYFGLGYSF